MHTATALDFFLPAISVRTLIPLGQGNINDTWRVDLESGEIMVLQRLHLEVFPDPAPVMHNMRLVTSHLQWMTRSGPPVFFRLIGNPQGQDYFIDPDGYCWRLLTYIDNSRTLTSLQTLPQAEEIGRLLGQFHLLVAGLDHAALNDPLPDFHVTPRYLEQYDAAAYLKCR